MKKISTLLASFVLLLTLFTGNAGAQSATALKFDPSLAVGDNSRLNYVGIGSPYRGFAKEITVEFWMYAPSANLPFGSVMGQGTDNQDVNTVWLMHPNTDGTMTFYVNDAGTLRGATITITAGSWHHYAGVASATGTKFYVDGALIGTGPGISGNIISNANSVIHIGKDVRYVTRYVPNNDPTNRYATMTIDEVRVWSRALCQQEIINNKNGELFNPTGQTKLESYYTFNQGIAGGNNATETTLYDQSGNGRNGTLYNFALTGANSNWVTSGAGISGTAAAFVLNPISGNTSICAGTSTTLSQNISGGSWSSSNTSVATINSSTGVVNALAAGTTTITYTSACGVVTTTLTVKATPVVTIAAAGGTTACPGSSVTLNATAPGGSTYQWSKDGVPISGATGASYSATASGSYTATVVNNGCSSVASNAVSISVTDVTAPTITCPPNQTLNLDGSCNATLPDYRSLLSVSDNCTPAGSLTITQSPAAGTVVNAKGALIVTFTVTDASNNSRTCTITVDKKDVTPPVITCVASKVVNSTPNVCGAVVTFINPTATDNCSGSAFNFFNGGEPNDANVAHEDYLQLYTSGTWNDLPEANLNRSIVEFNSIISTIFSGYSLIGTFGGHTYYISTGSAGWQSSRNAALAIGGDLASINTLGESQFLAPYGGSTWVGGYQDHNDPSYVEPGNASQNFGGWKWVDGTKLGAGQITITQIAGLASGSTFPVGVTTNTFRATDESGNSSTCSFTVTVTDIQAPTITCPGNQTLNATSAAGAVVTYATPVGTDNCPGATTVRTAGLASGSTFPIGTTTVTHTVTDNAGLTATCSFTVTVNAQVPAVVCPSNITVGNDPNQCSAVVNFVATETQGIPASTITYSKAPGTAFPVGTTTVTVTATNAIGTSTCSFTVTVTALDTDGDGVPDACDEDADNDGIPNSLECNKSNFFWSNPPAVNGNTATGTINGIGYTYTSSSPISTTSSMFGHNTFPASYGVPNANPTIQNLAVTNNTISFASPMTNPVLVFASVGQLGLPVPINFSAPVQVVWSQNVVQNSPTQVTGTEGFVIIRMMGTFSSISFNYLVAENYCNFAFGADFQTCGDTDGDGIPDYLDTDSDNDGCPDAIEGTMSFSMSQTSNGRLIGGVDSRGIPLLAGAGQGIGTSKNYVANCFCQAGLDETKPVVITKNITVNLDASGNAAITAAQIDNGSTDNCGIASLAVSKTNFNCSDLGANTVTLSVTDTQGNVGTGTATVTVTDVTAPVITCAANQTLNLDASCNAKLPDYRSLLTATDNCTASGTLVITQSPAAGTTVSAKGALIVTFTVTDASNNSSTCTMTVDKRDVTAPVINCVAPIAVNNNPNVCGAVVTFATPTATDNCSGSAFNFFNPGEPNNYQGIQEDFLQLYTNGTWNDLPAGNLNRSIVEFNSIISTTFPGYSLIGTFGGHTYYVSTGSAGWQNSRNAALAIGGDLASINTLGESQFLAPYGGSTWVGGYQDHSDPSYVEPGNASQNFGGWKWVDGTKLGAGQITITQIAGLPSGSTFPVGVTTNTFRATDESGNSSTCSFTVTVTDNQRPVFSNCPSNITVIATSASGAAVSYATPVGTDNCPGVTTTRTAGLASGATFPIGTTVVTYTATDAAGLTAQCSFSVTVRGVPPAVVCPGDIVVSNSTGQCGTNVNFAATETQAIPASVITYSIAPGSFFATGKTAVTATATNAVGVSSCTFYVTVTDNENPVINPVTNISVNNDAGKCGASVSVGATATDNCGVGTPAGLRSDGLALSDLYPVGTTTITWSVTDINGNAATPVTQTVVVTDNEIPVITSNGNKSVNNDAGKCGATVAVSAAATDNCEVGAPSGSRSDGMALTDRYPVGTTTITWNVTDIHGNAATPVTQTIVVTDNELPVITSNGNQSVNNDPGKCGATVAVSATAVDNCEAGAPTGVRSDGQALTDLYPVGTTTITWNAMDIHGNAATTVTQTIIVTDNEIPVITSNGDKSVNNDAGKCDAAVAVSATATDNCSVGAVLGTRSDALPLNAPYPVGTTTITWTVADIHGNAATPVTQTVVVTDVTIPVITMNGNKSVNNDPGKCGATVVAEATAADNCGVTAPTGVRSDGQALSALYPVGTTTITWNVTDIHGNPAVPVMQTIIVTDNELPVISAPANQVFCANYGGVNTYTIPAVTLSDNCGIATTTFTVTGATSRTGTGSDASGVFAIGVSTVTWTVVDIHGNVRVQSITVTINPLPVATITAATADAFCNKLTLTGSSTLTGPFTYTWSNTNVNTPQISLGLTDPDGVYSLYTTDNNNCRSEFAAKYTYAKQNLASSYTILATKEAELGKYNKVATGSVGVMSSRGEAEFKSYSMVNGAGSFVKAPKIDKDGSGIVITTSITGVASVTLPTMQFNTASTNNLPEYNNANTQNATIPGNYKNLTVKKGISVTVTGNTFGNIRLETGASIRFTSPVLNIGRLSVDDGARDNNYSYVRFAPNTSVRVSSSVTIGSQVRLNPESNKVTFYMGDTKPDEEKFTVKGGDTRVIANVYMPDGKLRVTATNSEDDDHDKCDHKAHYSKDCKHRGHGHNECNHQAHDSASCNDDVYMTGLFIAEEVESKGNTVIWNSFDCSAPAVTPVSNSITQATQAASTEKAVVRSSAEDLKVTVLPNPSSNYFTLKLESRHDIPVNIRVMDAQGRVVDAKSKVGANSTVQVGHSYISGTYFAELIQGNIRKVVQLIKITK